MTSNRFFVSCFLLVVMFVFVVEKQIYAQIPWPGGVVPFEIRDAGIDYTVAVPGNHMWYRDTDYCSAHKTKMSGNKFEHIHIDASLNAVGYINGTTIQKTVTAANVRARFNIWAEAQKVIRNAEGWSCSGGENLACNCYGYSFGYNTWIQDPGPIFADDYSSVPGNPPYPLPGDAINVSGHIISVVAVNPCESPYLVVETNEKMRHSGIYNFAYAYWGGLGDGYKNYYRKK